jgi:hypothetical protein
MELFDGSDKKPKQQRLRQEAISQRTRTHARTLMARIYLVVPEKHPFGIFGDQFSDLIDHRSQNVFKIAANGTHLNPRKDFLLRPDSLSARNSR